MPDVSDKHKPDISNINNNEIEDTKDPRYMMELGGMYYERRNFDKALKYYNMAAEYNYEAAFECLGYIWYYGRTGERDFKKAYENFSKAAEMGNLVAQYKLADMYKNGYYVDQDYAKYCEIIESLFDLYYLLKKPCKASFVYAGNSYEIEAVEEAGQLVVRFGDSCYLTIDSFMENAEINETLLTSIWDELHSWRIVPERPISHPHTYS